MTPPVTLADVAERAGVDRSTASRVLNGQSHRVSEATRERVLLSARELGYQPNPLARGLRTARTWSLGIAVPQLENPVFPELIIGAEQAARARGYSLLISHSQEAGALTQSYTQLARVNRVDGLLVATLEEDRALERALRQSSIPFVMLNRALSGTEQHVVFDSFEAARMATAELIALGHRRIAHLAGRERGFNATRRLAGYRAALEGAGLRFDPALVAEAGYTYDGGERAMRDLLDRGPVPTAVMAATVLTAAGALRRLHEARILVPEQMSIIAIHDVPLAEMLQPRLSTVRLPLRALGAAGADGLIDLIEGVRTTLAVTLPPECVVLRESTAPPR